VPEEAADIATCDVCERTILRGERTDDYIDGQGQHVLVCSLCRSRAEASGMVPAHLAATLARPDGGRRRGFGVRRRIGKAAGRARRAGASLSESAREVAQAKRAERAARVEAEVEAPQPPAQPRRRESAREEHLPDGQNGAEQAAPPPPRPRKPLTPQRLMRYALEAFNQSAERRKVAGLIRSLGEPSAGIRPAERDRAVLTVAWELSWYQWEIAVGSQNGTGVREVAKGGELGELPEEARAWNASVGEDGELSLALAAARRDETAPDA
jgi:hypothetical protein